MGGTTSQEAEEKKETNDKGEIVQPADPRAGSSVEPGAAKDFLGAAPKLPGEKTPVRLADAVPDTSPAAKRMAEGTQVCVRNLAKEAKDEDLKKLFEGVGEVKEVSIKTLKNGVCKGYGFVTFAKPEEAQKAIKEMHEKPQEGGKNLLVTMADRQPGDKGKGKGKDEKGKGKAGKGKGKTKGFQSPYGFYPNYTQEQYQNAWNMHMQYYQQALQAQAYYSGFTGGVIPSEAAISAAATKKEAPQAVAVDKEFVGEVKSISSKNGYGFITCSETKAAYGRDVFVDGTLLPDIEMKSKVRFTVELSEKGHPRANKVTKILDGA